MNDNRCLRFDGSLGAQVRQLWARDSTSWPMLADGLASLRQARTRSFPLGEHQLWAQCNPSRARSVSAKVDAASIAARGCYLCPDRLPPEQHAIAYGRQWLILCNPAPIFDPHFTVTSVTHQPQRVEVALPAVLDLARAFDGTFTVFYNGPGSGASLPDHLHLQAAPANILPFERALVADLDHDTNHGRSMDWVRRQPVAVGTTRSDRLPAVVLTARDRGALEDTLLRAITVLGRVCPAEPEPMLNLFAVFHAERWVAWLAPRAGHRPRVYGEGPEDYLISPGAVDVAGLVICPRERDYDRLGPDTLESILREVLLPPAQLADLRRRLADVLPGDAGA